MAMEPRIRLPVAGSTATLDLKAILASSAEEVLLSTRLSFSSVSDSSHSFDDTPPFPSIVKPLYSICDKGTSLLPSYFPTTCPSDISRSLITAPTGPRLKFMLIEKISVQAWNESVSASDTDPLPTWDAVDDSLSDPSSRHTPDPFATALTTSGHSHSGAALAIVSQLHTHGPQASLRPLLLSAGNVCRPDDPAESSDSNAQSVPTIMVSSSTAVLPLSLDSSQNLHPDVPLAVRRGKKLPPALSLGKPKARTLATPDSPDPYPDMQSSYLGSPTCQSPTFSFSSDDPPSKFNMGLSAMCNNLKALVPPLFSPTGTPRSKLEPATRWGMVHSTQLPDADDEEWGFARDLLADLHTSRERCAEVSPPPSPVGNLPYAAEIVSPVDDQFPPQDTPPLEPSFTDGSSDEEEQALQTPSSGKQLRRKTVIIQAPSGLASEAALAKMGKVEKIDKLYPDSVEQKFELHDDFDEPVPFEIPAWVPAPTSDSALSTPPGSRRTSTSSTRYPVRGILKEKKCVRFSSVPSLHEYDTEKPEQPSERHVAPITRSPAPPTASPRQQLDPNDVPSNARTPSSNAPRKSSPLRNNHSPGSVSVRERPRGRSAAHCAAPAMPLPPTPPFVPGQTMAKHPAVQAFAQRSRSPHSSPSPSAVGAGVGGAVVGAPGLQSPTPVLLEAQRRAPLKSINRKLSLPKERRPCVLIPVRPPSVCAAPPTPKSFVAPVSSPKAHNQENVRPDVRTIRTASVPVTPRLEHRGGDARRQSEGPSKASAQRRVSDARGVRGRASLGGQGAGQKNNIRMPVQLRSILTKLRT